MKQITPRPVRWLLHAGLAAATGLTLAVVATAIVVFQQYPAHVSVPETVVGLPQSVDLFEDAFPAVEVPPELLSHPGFVQAYSDEPGQKVVFVIAVQRFLLLPASELAKAVDAVSAALDRPGAITDVPPGELGGSAACRNGRATGSDRLLVVCGWADHGSLGLTFTVGARDRDEAARWMLDVREAVVTR